MNFGVLRIHVLGPLPENLAPDRSQLTGDEWARAATFRHAVDASRWAFCRVSLRRILGGILGLASRDVPLATMANGKPTLRPPFDHLHFNLSHCKDLALVVVSLDGVLGVDVEPSPRAVDLIGCEESFCHPDEIRDLPDQEPERAEKLMGLWTAKEAVLKALGTGLFHPPETIRLHMDQTGIRISPDTLPPALDHHVVSRLGQHLAGAYTAAICHPRVSEIFEILPSLESTNSSESRKSSASDLQPDG